MLDRAATQANIEQVKLTLDRRWLLLAVNAVLALRLAAVFAFNRGPVFDEAIHLQTAQQYGTGLPTLEAVRNSTSAAGPVFYVLFGNIGGLVNYNLTALRLLVFAFALGCLILFAEILTSSTPHDSSSSVLLLATMPYFLTLSGLFMTEIPAIFFGLLALLGYVRYCCEQGRSGLWLYVAAAALAIATRQYFIFLPLGLAAAHIIGLPRRWPITVTLLSPLFALVPLLLIWHGLVPPGLQERHHPGLYLQNLSSVLVWTGFYLLPWAVTRPQWRHLFALLAVPIVLLAPTPGNGIIGTLLALSPRPIGTMVAAAMATIGMALVILLAPRAARPLWPMRPQAAAAIAFLLLLVLGGPTTYERYLLLGYPLLLMCALSSVRPWQALLWSLAVQLPLGVVQLLRFVAR
jgi:hypothetical protein